MDAITILLLVAYGSLLLEITVFPISSEASTYQLLFRVEDGAGEGALAEARRRPTGIKVVLFLLPTALGVALFLIPPVAALAPEILDHLFPIGTLATRTAQWCGAALVLAGRLVTFVSVLQLRAAQRRRDRALGTGGLFRWSRNPGLVGMFAFYIGLALIFPCWVLFVGFVLYGLNMHQRVRMEESRLALALGDRYRTYAARTPRYLGWRTFARSES